MLVLFCPRGVHCASSGLDRATYLPGATLGRMRYDRTVIGYHGCHAATAERVLSGDPFEPSCNPWDWLGKGSCFWEYGFDRAWRWAEEHCPDAPAVVGAVIQLVQCFDLTDTRYTNDLSAWAELFVADTREDRLPVPKNRGDNELKGRYLDCAIINWTLEQTAAIGIRYNSVRCLFVEGDPVYVDRQDPQIRTAITKQSHIQVAVREPECILGVFRPTGTQPPYSGRNFPSES